MLRLIATHDPLLEEKYIETLGLEKKEPTPLGNVYQKWGWILVALYRPLSSEDGATLAETFLPDRLYLPYAGESLDVVHEIGDVIAPNVFLSYDSAIERSEITEENHDTIASNPRFLEIFDEQKDYYVEDYGLSVGGIVVDWVKESISDELATKLMGVYEADVYVREDLSSALDIVSEDEVPTLILMGIVRGKSHPKHVNIDPYILVTRNMIATIRLMEEE